VSPLCPPPHFYAEGNGLVLIIVLKQCNIRLRDFILGIEAIGDKVAGPVIHKNIYIGGKHGYK
jgi:hypothetical protein